MSGYASRCNECGRSTTVSAFLQVASLGILIVAALIVGGIMPLSSIAFIVPDRWIESSPLPVRTVTGEVSGGTARPGGSNDSPRGGYGAEGQAPSTAEQGRRGSPEEPVTLSEAGASRDPACGSEAAIRRQSARYRDWDRADLALIACRRVRTGFTGEQVIASRGRPLRRQTAGVAEVWIYRDIRVVLERDTVVSIRE